MNLKYIYILSFIVAIGLFSCDKEEVKFGNLQVRIIPLFEGEPFVLGEVYTDINGNRIRVENFRMYLSNFNLGGNGTGEVLDIGVYDLSEENTLNASMEAGNYSSLQFSVGVPEESNKDNDPTTYPNDHPLSVAGSGGMFWTWNSGYIFVKFDGKADTTGTEGEDILHPFAFHCGEDVLYQTHSYNNANISIPADGTTCINMKVNIDQFFYSESDTIDVQYNYLTHTSGNFELAERFMNNLEGAIEMEY